MTTTQVAAAGEDQIPVFVDGREVVDLVDDLCTRPRFGDGPKRATTRQDRRGGRGLPMVCLVRPPELDQVLRAFSRRLAKAAPHRVPHTLVSLDPTPGADPASADRAPLDEDDATTIRRLLITVAEGLSASENARGGRLRFRRFSLVAWLMDQNLDGIESEKLGWELRRRLRARDLVQRFPDGLRADGDPVPDWPRWLRWLVSVLRLVPPLVFALKVTGRVPLLSGKYRWFLRQPYVSPSEPGGFVGFAEKLTATQWANQDPEQVALLLTNAFLEDLRRAYRWRVLGGRRMAYPVVLLDNITRLNGGYTLLRLINDVRNETGGFDPLLVISGSRKVPPDALVPTPPGRPQPPLSYDARNAADGHRSWQRSLLAARRARRHTTWYLSIVVAEPTTVKERADAEQRLSGIDTFRVPRPPVWSSRLVPMTLAVVLLAGGVVGYTTWSHGHCAGWTDWPGFGSTLTMVGGECVGVTDGTFDLFQPTSPLSDQVRARVVAQNQQAQRLHDAGSPRPYVTLVLLDTYVSASGAADGLTAQRETLEGIAVAQSLQLKKNGDSDPLLRVLIANGGRGMRRGSQVARQLRAMAARDPSLVGVVGLNISSQPTVDTIRVLTEAGLPMVASTLSADSLADDHPMYYQVSPQNRRQAAVAASFAAHLLTRPEGAGLARSVRVYYSDDAADMYSTNLRDDVLAGFRARGFATEAVAFTPNGPPVERPAHTARDDRLIGNPVAAGRDSCGYPGLVYYAGRGVPDFGAFVDGAAQCPRAPALIADDDVTRYIAAATARERNQAVPFWVESFAVAPTSDQLQPFERNFYHELNTLFPFEEGENGRALDGHAALAYDAALTMITAVEYLREGHEAIPVTPSAVWRELNDIHTSGAGRPGGTKAVQGATGTIDFGGDVTRHVPLDKPVAILSVDHGQVGRDLAAFCGAPGDPRHSLFCPAGE